MSNLPLTSHEKGLINQIQGEINELNKEANSIMEKMDKSTDPSEQEKLINDMLNKSKRIRERSQVREDVIQGAWNRLKN